MKEQEQLLNHINKKMAVYRDCTLSEILIISFSSFIGCALILSMATLVIFQCIMPGFAASFLLSIMLSRFFIIFLQKKQI